MGVSRSNYTDIDWI